MEEQREDQTTAVNGAPLTESAFIAEVCRLNAIVRRSKGDHELAKAEAAEARKQLESDQVALNRLVGMWEERESGARPLLDAAEHVDNDLVDTAESAPPI